MTEAPPSHLVVTAATQARLSPCAKSKRGVVAYRVENNQPVGLGFNGQPEGFACTGTAACRTDCAKLCLHAEQRAIYDAMGRGYVRSQLRSLALLHVEVVDDKVVAGKRPCCWQCSRLVLELDLRGIWLLELIDPPSLDAPDSRWRFYGAVEFHEATLANLKLGDRA